MARLIVALVAVLLLTGCESDDDYWGATQSAVEGAWPFSESNTTTTTAATAPVNERCAAVAYARRADAKANGFDDDMLVEVYQRTYAECAAWDRGHTVATQPN